MDQQRETQQDAGGVAEDGAQDVVISVELGRYCGRRDFPLRANHIVVSSFYQASLIISESHKRGRSVRLVFSSD